MTPNELRAALDKLGFAEGAVANDEGQSAFARFLDVNSATVRRWARLGPPNPVAVLLRLMLRAKIDADKARKLLDV